MDWISYTIIGLMAGLSSGFFGIGGGVILIPFLIYLTGLSQHQAQGTTLAIMIPPIGILAAMKYYKEGNVNFWIAMFVCLGFVIGGFFGAHGAHKVDPFWLRKGYGILLLIMSIKMLFQK